MFYELLLATSLYGNPKIDSIYSPRLFDSLTKKIKIMDYFYCNDDTVNVDSLSRIKDREFARLGIILDDCDNCGFWDQAVVDEGKPTERMVYEIEVDELGVYGTLKSLNYSLERDGFKTTTLEKLIEHNKNVLPKDLTKIPKGTKIHWSGQPLIKFDDFHDP